jgi:hypothetical protein
MIKSLIGALVGSLTLFVIVSVSGLLLGWPGSPEGLLVAGGIGAIGGAILGWIRPGLFIKTILFFLEPSIFD